MKKTYETQEFYNDTFGKLRVIVHNGEPYFIATNVCAAFDRSRLSITYFMKPVKAEHKASFT